MKTLKDALENLIKKPLKIEEKLDYRIKAFKPRYRFLYDGSPGGSEIKSTTKDGFYTFRFTDSIDFEYLPTSGLKSRLFKTNLSFVSYYERESFVYSAHIFLGYQLYLKPGLGPGYVEEYDFPVITDKDWIPLPVERDKFYQSWLEDRSKIVRGSSIYFAGGIHEDD